MLILPNALQKGDGVAIVAPGSPFDKNKFIKGLSVLTSWGLQPLFSQDIFQQNHYLAGSDEHRAELIRRAFSDDRIAAVWCARGGYGAMRILGRLDYALMGSRPKIFIGSSDISAILNTLYSKCQMVSFHGPMIESLAVADEPTLQSLIDTLFSNSKIILKPRVPTPIHEGIATGRIAGGNLTTLCHLIGTPFQPDFSNTLLLLEDIGEAPYRIDRMLTQMKMAGCFAGVSGIILGSFENCGEKDSIHDIFRDIFSDINCPMLAGFEIGHGMPNFTIPIGVDAELDTHTGTLTILTPYLC